MAAIRALAFAPVTPYAVRSVAGAYPRHALALKKGVRRPRNAAGHSCWIGSTGRLSASRRGVGAAWRSSDPVPSHSKVAVRCAGALSDNSLTEALLFQI